MADLPVETDRYDLRPLAMTDLDGFHAVWSDPDVIFWGPKENREASRRWLQECTQRTIPGLPESGWFAVVSRADGAFVGDVVLQPAAWDPTLAEIGWHVAAAHQRQGVATEAALGLIDHAWRLGVPHVWATILPDNIPSRRVAERIGMHIVGEIQRIDLRHHVWKAEAVAITR